VQSPNRTLTHPLFNFVLKGQSSLQFSGTFKGENKTLFSRPIRMFDLSGGIIISLKGAHLSFFTHTLKKMLGCFNPILGRIWTNPAIGLHF